MIGTGMKKKEQQVEHEAVSEIREARWAVISFDRCAARDLTYPEAEEKLRALEVQKVSGLCIVPNETADRLPSV